LDAQKLRATLKKTSSSNANAKAAQLSDVPKALQSFAKGLYDCTICTIMTAHDKNCEGIVDYVEGRIATLRHMKMHDCYLYAHQCFEDCSALMKAFASWFFRLSLQDKVESIVWLTLVIVSVRVLLNIFVVTMW
jgi:hypothetical protein